MNVDHAKKAIEGILERYPSVAFTRAVSQPKPVPHDPCHFQFTLSRDERMVPNLFLNFVETGTKFSQEACTRKIEAAVEDFLNSEEDVHMDIT
jgi:hypothetical protein